MFTENNPSVCIEDELKKHGTYATNTSGVSMQPLFKTHRDVAVLKSVDRNVKKYDVVLYTDNAHRYILHRVIGVNADEFVIRGDNTFSKEYVKKDRVIAYLVSFNRNGKHHSADELGYKLYSRFWNFIYPIRRVKHSVRLALGKLKRKIFGGGSRND